MRVQCEYCDSYVESGTNCPNCGAILPVHAELIYGNITQIGRTQDGTMYTQHLDELYKKVEYLKFRVMNI